MENEIEKSRVNEIVTLHSEIGGYLKVTLDKAIRIGELLTEQKADLKHGEFGKWLKGNLQFTDRTARNYMNLYRNRSRFKTETVSDMTEAYRLLLSEERASTRAYRKAMNNKDEEAGFWEWVDYLISNEKGGKRLVTEEIEIPENWNYDESVAKVKRNLAELREGYIEARNDFKEAKPGV